MWLRSEVEESKQYSVALCQQPDGRRHFALHAFGSAAPLDTVLATELVPTDLLLARNFRGISKAVKLTSGEPFFVDAHGTWLTQEECNAMSEDSEVRWLNGLAPKFAPK